MRLRDRMVVWFNSCPEKILERLYHTRLLRGQQFGIERQAEDLPAERIGPGETEYAEAPPIGRLGMHGKWIVNSSCDPAFEKMGDQAVPDRPALANYHEEMVGVF